MRNVVFEYIPLKATEKETLWGNCIFVFDANILLNLYRFSIDASNTLIEALRTLSPRIWIPHQVAYEFLRRRCQIVFETDSKYTSFEKTIDDFITKAKELSNLKDDDPIIMPLKTTLTDWLSKCKQANMRVINVNEDSMLDQVLELFTGKTGVEYSAEQHAEFCKSGELRFASKTPPGYKDAAKAKSNNPDDFPYGDYIIWNQIMDYAKQNKQNVIFVTNDQKEDWWSIIAGRTIGPRTELIREFKINTGMLFHMYTMDGFITYYNKLYGRKLNAKIIQEFKESQNIEIIDTSQDVAAIKNITSQIMSLEEKLARSKSATTTLLNKYGKSFTKMPVSILEQYVNTLANINMYQKKVAELKLERNYLLKQNKSSVDDTY